jgi:methylisocitrate lyase
LRNAVGPNIPILANMTEFGQTPLFHCDELAAHGVAIVLYPLTAFRAMSKAAATVYRSVIADRTQANVVPLMQTRADLYKTLNYHAYEDQLDVMFGKEQEAAKPKPKL